MFYRRMTTQMSAGKFAWLCDLHHFENREGGMWPISHFQVL